MKSAPDPAPKKKPVIRCAYTKLVPLDELLAMRNPRNPNDHPPAQVRLLAKIMEATGIRLPIVVSNLSSLMTKGHGRLEAAVLNGYDVYPVDFQDYDSPEQETADLLADNLIQDLSVMKEKGMNELLRELAAAGFDTELAGLLKKDEAAGDKRKKAAGKLKDRFVVSPFTVLDTRNKEWAARRQLWLQIGMAGSIGSPPTNTNAPQPKHVAEAKEKYETAIGRKISWDAFLDAHPNFAGRLPVPDIFNPVIVEALYNWFLPTRRPGRILDPFAGDSVRGIVAAMLGHSYTGIEIDAAQVSANTNSAREIFDSLEITPKAFPRWIVGDAGKLDSILDRSEMFDFIIADIPTPTAVATSNPDDLAGLTGKKYETTLARIIQSANARLFSNRFAAWIAPDYRDRETGSLCSLLASTIDASPAPLYNHAVIIAPVQTLAFRVGKEFNAARQLGKAHKDAAILYNGCRIELEAQADAAFENLAIFSNGEAARIPESLGPLSAREVIPLGDILERLTTPTT